VFKMPDAAAPCLMSNPRFASISTGPERFSSFPPRYLCHSMGLDSITPSLTSPRPSLLLLDAPHTTCLPSRSAKDYRFCVVHSLFSKGSLPLKRKPPDPVPPSFYRFFKGLHIPARFFQLTFASHFFCDAWKVGNHFRCPTVLLLPPPWLQLLLVKRPHPVHLHTSRD